MTDNLKAIQDDLSSLDMTSRIPDSFSASWPCPDITSHQIPPSIYRSWGDPYDTILDYLYVGFIGCLIGGVIVAGCQKDPTDNMSLWGRLATKDGFVDFLKHFGRFPM